MRLPGQVSQLPSNTYGDDPYPSSTSLRRSVKALESFSSMSSGTSGPYFRNKYIYVWGIRIPSMSSYLPKYTSDDLSGLSTAWL